MLVALEPMMAARASTVMGMAVLLGTASVSAGEVSPRVVFLQWERAPGAESCIDGRTIETAVEKRLARKVFVDRTHAERHIRALVQRRPNQSGWEIELKLTDDGGKSLGVRRLSTDASKCQALVADVAMVLALMVDIDEELVNLFVPEPAAEPDLARKPPQPPRNMVEPTPRQPHRKPALVDVGTNVRTSYGLFPGWNVGGGLHVGLDVPRLPAFELSFDGYVPKETSGQGPGARFFGATMQWVACLPWSRGRFQLQPCLGPQFGLLQVEGIRLAKTNTAIQPLFNIAVDARLSVQLAGSLWLRIGAGMIVPLRRDSFTYQAMNEDRPELHRASAVVPIVHIGLSMKLPLAR